MLLANLENTLVFLKKKAFVEAFVFSNFNYCPLAWHFTAMTSTKDRINT